MLGQVLEHLNGTELDAERAVGAIDFRQSRPRTQPRQAPQEIAIQQTKRFDAKLAGGNLSEVLWLQYLEALTRTITIQGAPQVTFPYVIWDWGGKETTPGLTYEQSQYLDRVPETPVADYQYFGAKQGFGDQYLRRDL